MTQRLFRIAAVALLTVVAAPAAAQDWSRPDPKAEPWRDARLRIGPLFFNPTFQIKDLASIRTCSTMSLERSAATSRGRCR